MLAKTLLDIQKEKMQHLKRKEVKFDGQRRYKEFDDISRRI